MPATRLMDEAEVRRGSKVLAKMEVGDVIGEISFVLMMAAIVSEPSTRRARSTRLSVPTQ